MNPDSVQTLIDEKNRLTQSNLQKEFVEGVIVKTMIKAKLREHDKQCALEVMSNKYKINETDYKKDRRVDVKANTYARINDRTRHRDTGHSYQFSRIRLALKQADKKRRARRC